LEEEYEKRGFHHQRNTRNEGRLPMVEILKTRPTWDDEAILKKRGRKETGVAVRDDNRMAKSREGSVIDGKGTPWSESQVKLSRIMSG